MFYLEVKVQAANRNAISAYLHAVWESVMTFTHPMQRQDLPKDVKAKFATYVAAEEGRLRSNLEDVRYQIDDFVTFGLVTGAGRIETVCSNISLLVL